MKSFSLRYFVDLVKIYLLLLEVSLQTLLIVSQISGTKFHSSISIGGYLSSA